MESMETKIAGEIMNEIQKYFRYRQSLIDQYHKGDMTKREYLEKNYEAVIYGNIKPFRNIDTVEKGLYNYQYYNALAKQKKSLSTMKDLDYELKREYQEQSQYYYNKKDKATAAVLRLIDYRNVEAYFVKVQSKYLKGKLFEIVLNAHDVVLHSTSVYLLKRLREEEVFSEESKISLIDEYVNHRY